MDRHPDRNRPAHHAALGGSTGWSGPGPHPHDAVSPISFAGRIRTPVLILLDLLHRTRAWFDRWLRA
ncbi:hypothetical protein ADL15_30955 [Actinoplanes awajinensis subsp. mycoplanecinus]|uniref:Uncharacterized protein n=1 Tax=Actinoplanes awajinensis subsp. mycoplanecinus TaxID=135947 RepID=A0A117MPJ3_9ACTN|nr:hypothetical protein ADL15_30955 [Actinoplanes awajinensis subsp. mycoplanecinus]